MGLETMTVVILICPLKQVKLLIWKGSQDKFISLKKIRYRLHYISGSAEGVFMSKHMQKNNQSHFSVLGGLYSTYLGFVFICVSTHDQLVSSPGITCQWIDSLSTEILFIQNAKFSDKTQSAHRNESPSKAAIGQLDVILQVEL